MNIGSSAILLEESVRTALICAFILLRMPGTAFLSLATLSALQTLRWFSIAEAVWRSNKAGLLRNMVKQNTPVVRATVEGGNSAEFVTVIAPSDRSQRVPDLKVLQSSAATRPGWAIEVSGTGRHGSCTDYLAWSPSIADHDTTSINCQASVIWSRSAEEMRDGPFAACNVQQCRSNRDEQIRFVAPSQPAAWVSWDPQCGWIIGAERFE